MEDIITLDYGSGGLKTSELIDTLLLPALDNAPLRALGDGAVLSTAPEGQLQSAASPADLVFSTDSFVVSPWRFPGGDIGKLCVCGTVNDLCMAGGLPLYLSLAFILEEGFAVKDLKEIITSIAAEAKKAGVIIATGDTKVVERGKGDGIYINTSGIGLLRAPDLGKEKLQEGDAVILSGSAGCHGAAVMMARAGLTDENGSLLSDCRLLTDLSGTALSSGKIRLMRDPTRGGIATTLNEFVEKTPLSIELDERAIPVDPAVAAACDLLGLDPLYCACEGRLLAVCAPEDADAVVSALHTVPGGEQAAVIGKVTKNHPGCLTLSTRVGGQRLLSKLTGQQLPRIC